MQIFKEPLFHFILIGAVLFGVYGLMNRPKLPESGMIISTEKIGELAELFSKDWNRAPSEEELQRLVDDYIREELAFREGMAMGMDTDDVVIRQRIRQKLETIVEEDASKTLPTDADLKAYIAANAAVFREPGRISFYQVFLAREHHGQAAALREKIKTTDQPISSFGDSSPLGPHYAQVTAVEIDHAFGLGFSDQLIGLAEKSWSEPLESELGFHLVYIELRTPGVVPDLGSIRNMVVFEWENEQRLQRLEEFYADLFLKYDVSVEDSAE